MIRLPICGFERKLWLQQKNKVTVMDVSEELDELAALNALGLISVGL